MSLCVCPNPQNDNTKSEPCCKPPALGEEEVSMQDHQLWKLSHLEGG